MREEETKRKSFTEKSFILTGSAIFLSTMIIVPLMLYYLSFGKAFVGAILWSIFIWILIGLDNNVFYE